MKVSKQQEDLIISLNKKGKSPSQISAILGISEPTVEEVLSVKEYKVVSNANKKAKKANKVAKVMSETVSDETSIEEGADNGDVEDMLLEGLEEA